MKQININQDIIAQTPLQDCVQYLNQLLSTVENNSTITLEPGTYDLHSLYAMEKFCYISNNDSGVKKMAFFLEHKENITIDGQGSHLNCIGRILPFYFSHCKHITLKNFTVDYARAFMSQGTVVAAGEDFCDLTIDQEEFPFFFRNGSFRFTGEEYFSDHVHGLLEYEGENKRPIATAFDTTVQGSLKGEALSEGLVRIHHHFQHIPEIGNILTIKHEERFCPALTIDCCETVHLENIWIKQAGAMAVVAQLSKDIYLKQVDVYPDPSSPRVFSANADATHFVNCWGDVVVEQGRYESMLDDVINVHGNYLRIDKVWDSKNIMVAIPHFQQEGFMNFKAGDEIAICQQLTLMTHGKSKIKTVKKINQKYYLMTLETGFDFVEGNTYCIDNVDYYPKVLFKNNICGKNRARGLILTSTKETIVEGNVIDSEGSAIKVNSDMKNWYESAAIGTFIVRKNKLTRKNHGNWGTALIDIDPGMKEQIQGTYFHGNMLIEDNEMFLEESPLFFGYSFDTVTLKNNKITVKNQVKAEDWDFLVQTSNCNQVVKENNMFLTSKEEIT